MKAGRCIDALNPYDWLPAYGETGLDLTMMDGDLHVVIKYDGDQGIQRKKEIVFLGVVYFSQTVFPGVDLGGVEYSPEDRGHLYKLVEFPDSEVAAAWTRHFSSVLKIKHFRIFFMSANIGIFVFSRDFFLRDLI